MSAIATIKTTVKKRRGGARIWMEGTRLDSAGFARGTRYTVEKMPASVGLILSLDTQGEKKVSGRNRGEKSISIIDLSSAAIAAIFSDVEAVSVSYFAGRIEINKDA